MFYSDNPGRDADRYIAHQEALLESRPVCDCCGEHIQDDYYYRIGTEIWCQECLDENRVYID